VGLERGPLSLVSTTEELLERKNSSSGVGNRDYGRRDPQNLALTSLTSGGRSVGIVRSRTQATEFGFICYCVPGWLSRYSYALDCRRSVPGRDKSEGLSLLGQSDSA
jgi:hypothetical protein